MARKRPIEAPAFRSIQLHSLRVLSTADLATVVGIPASVINGWMKGEPGPRAWLDDYGRPCFSADEVVAWAAENLARPIQELVAEEGVQL